MTSSVDRIIVVKIVVVVYDVEANGMGATVLNRKNSDRLFPNGYLAQDRWQRAPLTRSRTPCGSGNRHSLEIESGGAKQTGKYQLVIPSCTEKDTFPLDGYSGSRSDRHCGGGADELVVTRLRCG
jgi:hypothetical protein